MKVTRFSEAKAYTVPHHYDMRALRLQGWDPDGPKTFWTGVSHFLPGGGAGPDASPLEKVYVVLAGTVTIISAENEVVLGALDSCYIPANASREVRNFSNGVASILVIMPYPEHAHE